MDEARTVIRRLERIEALQGAQAPAAELLAEVRQLLREGEAWLAAERDGGGARDGRGLGGGNDGCPLEDAAEALAGCRETLARREGVTRGRVDTTAL